MHHAMHNLGDSDTADSVTASQGHRQPPATPNGLGAHAYMYTKTIPYSCTHMAYMYANASRSDRLRGDRPSALPT